MVYLDNAATTKVDPAVVDEMLPYFAENYGNAATAYPLGADAAEATAIARERVSWLLGCSPPEVYFTSGGTESDNWALVGMALADKHRAPLARISLAQRLSIVPLATLWIISVIIMVSVPIFSL